jgi:hypothetical protein
LGEGGAKWKIIHGGTVIKRFGRLVWAVLEDGEKKIVDELVFGESENR